MSKINIIGAGLAGCEAALYLAKKGYTIHLYEMKPKKKSPAHHSDDFAEIVCSNSLKSDDENTASGVFKRELTLLGSSLLEIAYSCRVPAGQALAVDRDEFSKKVTHAIKTNGAFGISFNSSGYLGSYFVMMIILSRVNFCIALSR